MPNQISDESLAGNFGEHFWLYMICILRSERPPICATSPTCPSMKRSGRKRPWKSNARTYYATSRKRPFRRWKNPAPFQRKPLLAARNLFFVLDTTKCSRVWKMLNEALVPHWPILWRVCARGFYFHNSKPLVDEPPGKEVYDPFVDPLLPVFEESECMLVLPRAKYGGFGLLLKLPGKLALIVPLYEFVIICEFRAMIERFDAEHEESFWRGYYLSAYTKKLETGEVVVTLRLNENGIQFDLERGSWEAFRNLVHRAWEHPEVRRLWTDSVLRYGEF